MRYKVIISKQKCETFLSRIREISKFYSSCATFVIYRSKMVNILFLASKNIGDGEPGMSVKWSIAFFDFFKEGVNELCVCLWKLVEFSGVNEKRSCDKRCRTRVNPFSGIVRLPTLFLLTELPRMNLNQSLSFVYIRWIGKIKTRKSRESLQKI